MEDINELSVLGKAIDINTYSVSYSDLMTGFKLGDEHQGTPITAKLMDIINKLSTAGFLSESQDYPTSYIVTPAGREYFKINNRNNLKATKTEVDDINKSMNGYYDFRPFEHCDEHLLQTRFHLNERRFNDLFWGNKLIEYTGEEKQFVNGLIKYVKFTEKGRKLIELKNWNEFIQWEKDHDPNIIPKRMLLDSFEKTQPNISINVHGNVTGSALGGQLSLSDNNFTAQEEAKVVNSAPQEMPAKNSHEWIRWFIGIIIAMFAVAVTIYIYLHPRV